jgi:hypothetical protein
MTVALHVFSLCTDKHWILFYGHIHHLEAAEEEEALKQSNEQGKVSDLNSFRLYT